MNYRIEKDSLGEMKVPEDAFWGAQTQRSYENFAIGTETMPLEVIRAFAFLKKAAARANYRLGKLSNDKLKLISSVCDEILAGALDPDFPLKVWQTGSGTQSNMNVNEVIANVGNNAAGDKVLHPNDDVNMSQSSNDTFPTAMHIAAVLEIESKLIPALDALIIELERLEKENEGIVKSGRTHLQDATPIAFSQEIRGWRGCLENSFNHIRDSLEYLRFLAMGGTAVGTGLNAPKDFDKIFCEELNVLTGESFLPDENKFHALTSKDALVFVHGALKGLAANLMKIANDVRWLSSGPRLGLGEIKIPANEPGSSIMPGKVNPTQCEAVTMVAVQVMGNDACIGMAASQGNFELNVFMPVIIYNFLQSVRLLADVMVSFRERCVAGITPNKDKMRDNLYRSLMNVTALSPAIGYDNAAKAAKYAHEKGMELRSAVIELGLMTEEEFDEAYHPEEMC